MRLDTPLIDTALLELQNDPKKGGQFTRLIPRVAAAKADITRGLEQKKIYKVELEAAKGWFKEAVQASLRPLCAAFGESYRDTDPNLLWKVAMTYYLYFNQIKGAQKRISKYLHISEVKQYNEILTEAARLRDAMEALKPYVVKGRIPSNEVKIVDLTNTGTCSICMHLQKLEADKTMVHHGFSISDGMGHYFGQRRGSCFGCDYQPYELSNAGNIAYNQMLQKQRTGTRAYLGQLQAGEIKKLPKEVYRRIDNESKLVIEMFTSDRPEFARLLQDEINRVENVINWLTVSIDEQTKLITNWTLKTLPGDAK